MLFDLQLIRDLALLSAGDRHHLLEDFILSSPAPVYTAARLAAVLRDDLCRQASLVLRLGRRPGVRMGYIGL